MWHERSAPDPILPPRLFAEPIFMRGVCLAFITAVGLLGTTFLLPLLFQLVRGADASGSGLLVMPFMVANVAGAYLGGQLTRRLGRTRVVIIAGLAATVLGYAGLATVSAATPGALLVVSMVVVGAGIGVCLPTVLVMVQNAAPRRDVGTATGALLFLRSMGGAFGTTMVGAVLALQFAARMRTLGVTGVDFGVLRQGGALAALGPAAQAAGQSALASGFRLAFLVLLVLYVGAMVLAAGLRDLPLRATAAGADEEQPAALGH
jgi:MFS family permease